MKINLIFELKNYRLWTFSPPLKANTVLIELNTSSATEPAFAYDLSSFLVKLSTIFVKIKDNANKIGDSDKITSVNSQPLINPSTIPLFFRNIKKYYNFYLKKSK